MTPAKINGESGRPCSTLSTDSVQPSSTVRSMFWVRNNRLLRMQPLLLLQQCVPVKTKVSLPLVSQFKYACISGEKLFLVFQSKSKIRLSLRGQNYFYGIFKGLECKSSRELSYGTQAHEIEEAFVHFQLVKCEVCSQLWLCC